MNELNQTQLNQIDMREIPDLFKNIPSRKKSEMGIKLASVYLNQIGWQVVKSKSKEDGFDLIVSNGSLTLAVNVFYGDSWTVRPKHLREPLKKGIIPAMLFILDDGTYGMMIYVDPTGRQAQSTMEKRV